MRVVEAVQIAATMVMVFASVVMVLKIHLLKRLKTQNAISSENGVSLPKLNRITQYLLSRMLKKGVIRVNQEGLYFFDEGAYRSLRKRRVTITIIAVLVAVALIFLLYAVVGK